MDNIDLASFNNSWFDPGRGALVRSLWCLVNCLFFLNPIPVSIALKRRFLILFGARIGDGVVIKPRVNIKYPWNLQIGGHSWIGEGVWLDSLTLIRIGENVCISQGAYLCTGNHDWKSTKFGLIVGPIVIENNAWIAAQASVGPGVTVRNGAILGFGAVACQDLEAWSIYAGNPAAKIRQRVLCGKDESPLGL